MRQAVTSNLLSRSAVLAGLLLAAAAAPASADVAYATAGSTYTQDFNSLAGSGSNAWTNDSTLAGWFLYRQPVPGTAIASYTADTGASNAGAVYSYGSAGSGDRALGSLGSGGTYWGSPTSGALAGWVAVAIDNATGQSLTSFTVTYDGEQWRNGGNTSAQTMNWEYGIGSSFASVTTWTSLNSLAFTSPIASSTAGALDGNAAANRVADISQTVNNPGVGAGQTLWIRYTEVNDAGNDHGLAVDNFRFSATTAVAVPEPAAVVSMSLGMLGVAGLALRRRVRRSGL